jgi:hypothetical protein
MLDGDASGTDDAIDEEVRVGKAFDLPRIPPESQLCYVAGAIDDLARQCR